MNNIDLNQLAIDALNNEVKLVEIFKVTRQVRIPSAKEDSFLAELDVAGKRFEAKGKSVSLAVFNALDKWFEDYQSDQELIDKLMLDYNSDE